MLMLVLWILLAASYRAALLRSPHIIRRGKGGLKSKWKGRVVRGVGTPFVWIEFRDFVGLDQGKRGLKKGI